MPKYDCRNCGKPQSMIRGENVTGHDVLTCEDIDCLNEINFGDYFYSDMLDELNRCLKILCVPNETDQIRLTCKDQCDAIVRIKNLLDKINNTYTCCRCDKSEDADKREGLTINGESLCIDCHHKETGK